MDNKGDQARKWANDVYTLSEKCLMAHSIRAVEEYIEKGLGDSQVMRPPHRIKIRLCNSQKYLGRRALAAIDKVKGTTEIQVDKDIGFEQQRLAIAHELAHVLFAIFIGDGKFISFDTVTESACKLFEEILCVHHDRFYLRDLSYLRFPSLWPKYGDGKEGIQDSTT
jgi:hypothetical protein